MSGLREDGNYELSPRDAEYYCRRWDIPDDFRGMEYWKFYQAVLAWQGIKAEVKKVDGLPVSWIVDATEREIWEALSGLPGHDKPGQRVTLHPIDRLDRMQFGQKRRVDLYNRLRRN